jgi:hypothetical protein
MDTGEFLKSAFDIVEAAEQRGIKLRLLGSIAFRVHCPTYQQLFEQMQRVLTDVDVMAYKSQRDAVVRLMREQGYIMDEEMAMFSEGNRYCFNQPGSGLCIDVFIDKLDYCHPISFKGRLELDSPTIPLADLALEKLQIVEINEKDLKDMNVLLLEHGFGRAREEIDLDYIAGLLSEDWGFYYTVTLNLDKMKAFLPHFESLDQDQTVRISRAVDQMREVIEARPKSSGWNRRAKVGPKKKWYQDVSDKC